MFSLLFFFNSFYLNSLMLKNPSNKLSSSWNCCNFSPYMNLFWDSLSNSYWWSVMSPSLYDACLPSYFLFKVRLGRSRWSDALVWLTVNFRWSWRKLRIYISNCFPLEYHPLGGIDSPWSVWDKLLFWSFQTWPLRRITGWCHWLLSHSQWCPRPGSW